MLLIGEIKITIPDEAKIHFIWWQKHDDLMIVWWTRWVNFVDAKL